MDALEIVSYVILVGLTAFVFVEYVVGSWRVFEKQRNRVLLTCIVGGFWIAQGAVFLSVVPALKIINIPFVVLGLFLPPTVVLVLLLVSPLARRLSDDMSLRWTISTVESVPRIIVGTLFIVWFFLGRLPPIFAWVAGPGDIISGVFAIIAVFQLKGVAEYFGITSRHWSPNDIMNNKSVVVHEKDVPQLVKRINMAIWLVGFGIADFFAAPISAGITFGLGNPALPMSKRPMGFIPMWLVPAAFAMEVVAIRQLVVLKRFIRNAATVSDVEQ